MKENNFEKESNEVVNLILKCYESQNWDVLTTNEPEVVLKNQNADDNSSISFKRSEGKINANAEKLFLLNWAQKLEDKKTHESVLIEDRVLTEFSNDRHLRYQKYNFPWPLSARDTIVKILFYFYWGI
jgi:hypothetical protein